MIWLLMFLSLYAAELPDKTSLVTLALVGRHRGVLVWAGASTALIVQTVVALTAGRLLALVPKRPLVWVEVILFLGFAVWMWHEASDAEPDRGAPALRGRPLRVMAQVFALVFLAEFLDLTQMATVAYASHYAHHLWLLGAAASAALVLANGTVVLFGDTVLKRISGLWLQRGAAVLFGVVAIILGLGQVVTL
jgi:putative Ca2+/H+ antiporter (TMEM165/GDT1 family)